MGVGIHGEPGGGASSSPRPTHRRRDGRRHPRRSRAASRRGLPPARQRLRRHAGDGALSHVSRRRAILPGARGLAVRARARRQLCHLARHGRLLDHGHAARRGLPRFGTRRYTRPLCAGAHDTIQHAALQPPEREAAMRGLCVGFLGNTLMFSSWNRRVPCPQRPPICSVRFRRDRKMRVPTPANSYCRRFQPSEHLTQCSITSTFPENSFQKRIKSVAGDGR